MAKQNGNRKGTGKKGSFRGGNGSKNGKKNGDKEFEDRGNPPPDNANETQNSGTNTFDWLNRYPQLSVAVGSLPFPYRPGMAAPFGSTGSGTSYTFRVPGVMAIDWIPSLGIAESYQDAPNQVNRELYARVRSNFSADLDADGPDMLIGLVCLDSVQAYISALKRIYRTVNAWTPDNYLLPQALMRGYNVSETLLSNIRANISQFGKGINELVLQFNSFIIPDVFDIFHRHRWMSEHVYKDTESLYNAQLYLFCPNAFYKFAMVDTPQKDQASGATMIAAPWSSSTATYQTLIDYGYDMLAALYNWTTMRTINGYFSRAFDGANKYLLSELGYDEVQVPIYDESVLAQIENVSTLPNTNSFQVLNWNYTNMTISQNPLTNMVLCANRLSAPISGVVYSKTCDNVLNIRNLAPTVADVMTATRLQCMYVNEDPTSTTTLDVTVLSGTEIPLDVRLYIPGQPTFGLNNGRAISSYVTNATATTAMFFAALECFDWHPFITLLGSESGNATLHLCGDVHNVTPLSRSVLTELHRVCLYSEFNAFGIMT